MKKILLIILCLLLTSKLYSQDFIVHATVPTINACGDNVVQLTVTTPATATYANHIYLKIGFPNVGESIITSPGGTFSSGILTYDLGTSFSSNSVISLTYTMRLTCNSIPDDEQAITYEDPVSIYNGTTLLLNTQWSFGYNSTNNVTKISYALHIPFIDGVNSPTFYVNYIDWYKLYHNSTPVARVLNYFNSGDADFNGTISFRDNIPCTLLRFVTLRIQVFQPGNLTPIFNSSFPINANSILQSNIPISVPVDFQLVITEELGMVSYTTQCIDDCPAASRSFATRLDWGCFGSECHYKDDPATIVPGNKTPNIRVSRIAPVPAAIDPNCSQQPEEYWDQNFNTAQTWTFRIENSGDDVAINLNVESSNQNSHCLYYMLDNGHNTFDLTHAPGTPVPNASSITSSLLSAVFPTSNDAPACLATISPPPLFKKEYTFDILLPGESIDVSYDLLFCCPSGDDGDPNGTFSLFNKPKTFNTWKIGTEYYKECSIGTSANYGVSFSDPTHGYYEVYGNEISVNGNPLGGQQLFLTQKFSPISDVDVQSTSAPNDIECAAPLDFQVQNFAFNTTALSPFFLYQDANIFCQVYDPCDPGSMAPEGAIQFRFELDANLTLLTGGGLCPNNDLVFINTRTNYVWPCSLVTTVSEPNCTTGVGRVYEAIYDLSTFNPNNNGHPTLREFYEFMNNSEMRFKMTACCCFEGNTNPNYRILTYVQGRGQSCFIPMSEEKATVNIHCPGCNLPGMTVEQTNSVLNRETFGYPDADNDGLADNFTNVNSGTPNIDLTKSMVGDDLVSKATGKIDPGKYTDYITLADLRALSPSVDLNHLYLEVKVPMCNTAQFDITLSSIDLDFIIGGQTYTLSLNANDAASLQVHYPTSKDVIFNTGKTDIIFFDFSHDKLNTIFNATLPDFEVGDRFSFEAHFKTCKNFLSDPTGNDRNPNANSFRELVGLFMYLTAEDLSSMSIYDAFVDQQRDIAQEHWAHPTISNPQPGPLDPSWLYFCESYSMYHGFYSVVPYTFANIWSSEKLCKKSLEITTEVMIGGDAGNVFPFEFREPPKVDHYNIALPGGFGNYVVSNCTTGISRFHTYNAPSNTANCYPYNTITANFNGAMQLPTSGFLQPSSPSVDQSMSPGTFNVSICGTNYSVANFPSGDEYYYHNMWFPLTYLPCAVNQSEPVTNTFVQTSFNMGVCVHGGVVIRNSIYSNTIVEASNPENFIGEVIPASLDISTPDFRVDLRLHDSPEEDVENMFAIIPVTNFLGNLYIETTLFGVLTTIQGVPVNYQGVPSLLFNLGDGQSPFDQTFSILGDVIACTGQNLTIHYGWNCDGPLTQAIIDLDNICFTRDLLVTLNFKTPIVTEDLVPPQINYTLCETEHISSLMQVYDAAIQDVEFAIHGVPMFVDAVIPASIRVEYTSPSPSVVYNIIPVVTWTTNTITIAVPNNLLPPPGYVPAGASLTLLFDYNTSVPFFNVPFPPYNVPYNLRLNYNTYCNTTANSIYNVPTQWNLIDDHCNHLVLQPCPDPVICKSAGNAVLSAPPVMGSGSYTYSWTGPSVNSTAATITVSPLTTTTYSVTIHDNVSGRDGTASITVTVIDGDCCLGPYRPGIDFNYSNITASSLGIPGINTQNNILINGVFTVDQDFTFAGCDYIILGPGAIIDVLPSKKLVIDDCNLYSCKEMYRGIRVGHDATVDVLASWIEDAEYGIEGRDGSHIICTDVNFNDDFVGIYVSPIGTTSQTNITTEITGCNFTSSGHFVPLYPNQITHPLTRPYAGILIENSTMINVGIQGAPLNQFTGLNNGILCKRSNLTVERSTFRDIKRYDVFEAKAISAKGNGNIFNLIQIGNDDQLINDFENCQIGIEAEQMSVNSSENRFVNCDIGVRAKGCIQREINIVNNYIDANRACVQLVFNDQASFVRVNDNEFHYGLRTTLVGGGTGRAWGVIVQEQNSGNADKRIEENRVYSYANAMGAVALNNADNYTVDHNFIVLNNIINTNSFGIKLVNSQRATVTCNDVWGSQVNQLADNRDECGLAFFGSRSAFINCNKVTNTATGVRFSDNCFGGAGAETVVRSNDIGNHFNGLLYTFSADVDPQPFRGNLWFMPAYNGNAALNEAPHFTVQHERYDVFGNGSTQPGATNNPVQISPIDWFFPGPEPDENCDAETHHGQCETNETGGSNPASFQKLIDIALDSAGGGQFNAENVWKAKVALYEKLLKMPLIKDSIPELTSFFINAAGTTIQQVASMNVEREGMFENQLGVLDLIKDNALDIFRKAHLIRLCDRALKINSEERIRDSINAVRTQLINAVNAIMAFNGSAFEAVDSTLEAHVDLLDGLNRENGGMEIYERNERDVNEIYMQTVGQSNFERIRDHSVVLFDIAMQCPLEGGPSVYRARSLYYMIDPDMVYDDELACMQQGYVYKTSKSALGSATIYPNPSSDQINLICNAENIALLEITDGVGRVCATYKMYPDVYEYKFSVSDLRNGVYQYRIVSSTKELIDTGRFVVTK